MATRDAVLRSRRRLDERLAAFPSPLELSPPRSGWVRAVREALGMSLADLAGRMGVTAQTVHGLERSEQSGTAQLASLRRAAVAMDCTLVYAFVPNTSLHETVHAQAELLVDNQQAAVMHTMALEDQAAKLSPAARQALVDRVVQSGRLWTDR